MATNQLSEVPTVSTDNEDTPLLSSGLKCSQLLSNMATNQLSEVPTISTDNEDTPLLPGRTRSWLAMRYGNTRKCVSNKAALLILLWSFVVGLWGAMLLNPEMYLRIFSLTSSIVAYGVVVVFTCFFPLAGILADIKINLVAIRLLSLACS